MAKEKASKTRTEEMHRRLRGDILGGRLVPGARLKFPELCENYGVSVGAAREALTRLAAEGLVKSQAHQGYMVTPLSHEDLADLTRARVEIESLVLRMSVLEGDVHWESRAIAAHHVLERAPFLSDDDPDHPTYEWEVAHAAFHMALIDGCTNRRLLDAARSLRDEAELYRQWSVSLGQEPDRDLPGEHRALLDATVGRNADLAAHLLRDHIAHTAQLLISVATDEPLAAAEERSNG
ncbi:GntR family transcriptional regulator [Streptomyces sp. NPDC087844]|uniref:GntR family transcriptional regulator n=1 Tax=Streptomyces sp. NPDC087844 TaxID=3365805 RepID=UPI003827F582